MLLSEDTSKGQDVRRDRGTTPQPRLRKCYKDRTWMRSMAANDTFDGMLRDTFRGFSLQFDEFLM